jgi:plasmid stabilization system protein ParE
MDYKVVISGPAIKDLSELVSFIRRDNPAAAAKFGMRLIERAESLRSFPHRGRVSSLPGCAGFRETVEAPYRIIYRIIEEKKLVEIVGFRHGAREN